MKNKRKEIQPEDIWNDEKLDMVKEHILNHIKNKSPEDIVETKLTAKKYIDQDIVELLRVEIHRAFIHGQGNAQMMEAGLERDEVEDYVNWRMLSLNKQD